LAASNYTTVGTGTYDLGTGATGNIFAQAPLFVDATDIDGADDIHRTADDGLALLPCSPVINMGATPSPTVPTDILGNSRVGAYDMGAYEFQGTTQSISLANTHQTATLTQTGILSYGLCANLIATVQSNGASPIAGNTTAKVWIDTTQNIQFVKRHYEITPDNNASTATGRVTLYFTQTDFNAFNNQVPAPALLLPQNPTDNAGKANLKMEKRGGVSSDGTGHYTTYSGSVTTIDPIDTDILWNSSESRWEVSFNVTGFSGFFVRTQNSILPIELVSFTGKNKGSYNLLEWATASETNNTGFEIERSSDAISFEKIGFVPSKSSEANTYFFKDENLEKGILYYRLKQIDTDGKYNYSENISIQTKGTSSILIYPNPNKDGIFRIDGKIITDQKISILNAVGQEVEGSIYQNQIDLRHLPAGIYFLNLEGESFRLIKE
jgi:hypothetical protein